MSDCFVLRSSLRILPLIVCLFYASKAYSQVALPSLQLMGKKWDATTSTWDTATADIFPRQVALDFMSDGVIRGILATYTDDKKVFELLKDKIQRVLNAQPRLTNSNMFVWRVDQRKVSVSLFREADDNSIKVAIGLIGGWSKQSDSKVESPRSVPTNSLAFHLKSLGRIPTGEEREVIEAALRLMQHHSIRSDYPLRSVSRDDAKREWVLVFDRHHPDAGFELFLTRKDASYIEVHWAGTTWRTRYPAATKKKQQ